LILIDELMNSIDEFDDLMNNLMIDEFN